MFDYQLREEEGRNERSSCDKKTHAGGDPSTTVVNKGKSQESSNNIQHSHEHDVQICITRNNILGIHDDKGVDYDKNITNIKENHCAEADSW